MNRDEFLKALREGLSPLSQEERDAALRYYEEFLDEAQDEGVAIEELGDVNRIAQRILQDSGVVMETAQQPKSETVQVEKKTPFYKSVWFWLCMVLTLPVTLPILLGLLGIALGIGAGALGLVVGLGAAALGLVVALYASVAAVLVAGVYLSIASFWLLPGYSSVFLGLLGLGLSLTGAGLLMGLGLVSLTAVIFGRGKNRKEKAHE